MTTRVRDSMAQAAVLALCVGSAPLAAETPPYGKLLHDTECLACHSAAFYTGSKRRVKSLEALRTRVAYCRDDVGAEWNAVDTEAVVQYLNTYYRL